MRGLKNFIIGAISTMGVGQTLLAIERFSGIHSEVIFLFNTVISLIGGTLSATTVAYLQHKWKMKDEERKWMMKEKHKKWEQEHERKDE